MVCGVGAGKIFQTPAGWGRFEFCGCGAGADKKFQPVQDSSSHPVTMTTIRPWSKESI